MIRNIGGYEMSSIVENVMTGSGFTLHTVQTKKYKTINFVVKFRAPINRETITTRALLPYVLRQGTKNYPTERELQLKLDSLYGGVLSIDGAKKGNNHIISIRLEVANDKFIEDAEDQAILNEALLFLKELIFEPKVTNQDSFDQAIIEREKNTLRQRIKAIVDDKMAYANMRLIDEMCAGELYEIRVHGYEEDLENITAENAYKYYQNVLKENELDIYVLGDFDEQLVKEQVTNVFARKRIELNHQSTEEINDREQVKEIVEKQNIQQAKLHLGYRTHTVYKDSDYFALQVFNGLYGSFPSSKLFINVREKNSLAYYAASRIESHKGLLIVFSGIAPNDYEQAREIIELQMQAMRDGDFTESQLNETKELIINELLETLDHPQGIVELLYQQVLGDKQLSPDELFAGIRKVTKEDVITIAHKIEEDTVYLLTSEEDQANE